MLRRRNDKRADAWFTPDWSSIHDLVLCDGVIFVVDARTGARRLPLDDVDLHVLDLNPDEQEIDFPHNDVFQMVPDGGQVHFTDLEHELVWEGEMYPD